MTGTAHETMAGHHEVARARGRVRKVEEYADVSWTDARGSVRQARAPFERNAIVLREGKPFLAMRYFEADPNRRPVLNSTQQLEARAADDERMAFGGLCVLLGGIAGLAACWLWIFSIPKQPAP